MADTLANEGCAAEIPYDRDFMPSNWDAEEFTNVLAESDLNQTISCPRDHGRTRQTYQAVGTTKTKRN